MTLTTVTPLETYRNERAYPFCPGCGHGPILDRLNEALVMKNIDPAKVVLVSDIGCSGLSDQYFKTSAFHGLHGRSVTYASGIKMARPDLTVVVIMGDGGTGIGGTHLLNAARRNIGVTVIVMNNFNFGMTGGQHSTTTPTGKITSTTRGGNLERPLDICATVAANGAGYVARLTSFDASLADRMADAIDSDGFALLDIWELCTAYFMPNNKLTRRSLDTLMEDLNLSNGVLVNRDIPEYSGAYRNVHEPVRGKATLTAVPIEIEHENSLSRRFGLVLAGSAGGKVRSAARLVSQAAVSSGLWAAQRDDYPITVMAGHSIAEVILGPDPIGYSGITEPDALILLTEDGLVKSGRFLKALNSKSTLYIDSSLPQMESPGKQRIVDFKAAGLRVSKANKSLAVLSAVILDQGVISREALESRALGRHREANLKAIEAGAQLLEYWSKAR